MLIRKNQRWPKSVHFYTGFENYDALNAVFKCLEPKASRMYFWQGADKCKDGTLKCQNENINKPVRKRKLSLLEEFFFCFGRFLLDLSERFDVSVSLIWKIFKSWLAFFFRIIGQKKSNKIYSTTQIIIDGNETFVERATLMKIHAQTWSNSKYHNTWKNL